MHELMLKGIIGLATHDEAIIKESKRFAKENTSRPTDSSSKCFMACGAIWQDKLVREGYRMRVYVSLERSGSDLMRRLAERPANIAFLTGSVSRRWSAGAGNHPGQILPADHSRAIQTRSAGTWPCTIGPRRSKGATALPIASRSSPM